MAAEPGSLIPPVLGLIKPLAGYYCRRADGTVSAQDNSRKAAENARFEKLPGYCMHKHQAYATETGLTAADPENLLQGLKYDFGMEGFCLNGFYAAEAALRQAAMNEKIPADLSTIRFECFAPGSRKAESGREKVLKLLYWLDGLFSRQ